MVDGVDEPDSYMCMVVRHQDNVEQLFTLWVQLPQSSVHGLQSLSDYSSQQKIFFTVFVMSVSLCLCDFNLDKRESGSRGEGFIFMFDLVSQILLHSFLLKHLLLPLSPKQDPRRNSDGHCVLWLWLQKKRRDKIETGTMK